MKNETLIKELGRERQALKAALAVVEGELKREAERLVRPDGTGMPEAKFARLAQLNRMTVRKYLGK